MALRDGSILAGSQCDDLYMQKNILVNCKEMTKWLDTYTWQTNTTVTTLGLRGRLFDVVVDELAAWCFDNATTVGGGIVGCAFAESDTLGHWLICFLGGFDVLGVLCSLRGPPGGW